MTERPNIDHGEAELGNMYRDSITGYQGIATSITDFLYGCRRVGLTRLVEGKPEDFAFDEPALVLVVDEDARRVEPRQQSAVPGGPHDRGITNRR
jgi:hypothetical protein